MGDKTVLAISGSLRKTSFTEKMLDLLIEGMGDGFDIRKFYPHKMNISPCMSCFSCWGKENFGVCANQDDFTEILEAYKKADYLLIAFPLYYYSFPATVKNVIDRMFILVEPPMIIGNCGTSSHPIRFDRHPKTVLISSCAFPEIETFDIVRMNFKKICVEGAWPLSGEILIPGAAGQNVPGLFEKKYKLIKHAGNELVHGDISTDIMNEIAKPVMSNEDYIKMCNGFRRSHFT